jgi:hypothetical protein
MRVQATNEIRDLTTDETNGVSGGAFWEVVAGPVIVAGAAICAIVIADGLLNQEGKLKPLPR